METLLRHSLRVLLLLFPWQTIWIIRERFVDGVKWEYATVGWYATQGLLWLIIGIFLLWFFREWQTRGQTKFRLTRDRIFALLVLVFTLYAMLSSFWAVDAELASQQALWILEAFLLLFLTLAGPLPKTQWQKWFVLGSVLPCVLGIYQFLTQTTFASTLLGLADHPSWQAGTSIIDAENFGRWLRAYGPFTHPNVFGGYLVVAIAAADALRRADDAPNTSSFFSVILILQWTALFFTFSRSAWLAAVLWLVLTVRDRRRTSRRQHWLTLGVLLTLLTTLYFPLVTTRLFGDSLPEIRAKTERVSGYAEALALWKSRPLLGVGVGNYTIALRNAFPGLPIWTYQPAHNVPLLLLGEIGIIGVLLLIATVVQFFRVFPLRFRLCVVILPLMLLDHYLISSHAGLLLLGLFPTLSTPHAQKPA